MCRSGDAAETCLFLVVDTYSHLARLNGSRFVGRLVLMSSTVIILCTARIGTSISSSLWLITVAPLCSSRVFVARTSSTWCIKRGRPVVGGSGSDALRAQQLDRLPRLLEQGIEVVALCRLIVALRRSTPLLITVN